MKKINNKENGKEDHKNCSIEAYWETYKDLDRIYSRFAKECGLSDGEYWALVMIREGCTTQTQIREEFSLNKQTIHSAIKQLVKKGLIRLETKEDNQREKKILLTKEGEDFIRNHIDGMIQLEKKAWDMMRNEEQEQLIALSQRYNDLLESELERYLKSE